MSAIRTWGTMRSVKRNRAGLRLEPLEARRVLSGPGEDHLAGGVSRFDSEEELVQFLLDDALVRWDGTFGQPAWWGPWWPMPLDWEGPFLRLADFGLADIPAAAPGAAPQDHSDTNVQVAGVDESDIVETDGDHLYILSGQELVIVDSWTPDQMHVLSRREIEGSPVGQYLRGDRLVVIANTSDTVWIEPWPGGPVRVFDSSFAPYPYYEPQVSVTVWDVSDRSNPRVVQTTTVDGSYVDSRAVGDSVYLVSSHNFALPMPEVLCSDPQIVSGVPSENVGARIAGPAIDIWPPPETNCFYETREQYVNRVEGHVLELALPQFSSFDGIGDLQREGLLSQATDIYKPATPEYSNLISVAVFDMAGNDPGPVSSTSVPTTYSTQLFASVDSLYLVNPDWGWGWGRDQATSIFMLDMVNDGRAVDLVATGEVPGRVLNQFSMDEHTDAMGNEYFRIATSTGFGQQTDNRLFVLQQKGDQLDVIGRTESLAPGEQIYSVRYTNDTAYVVTFVQVDPLFAIDLSDPAHPEVKGKLKITGFSNYLHPVGDNFLIGLGREADPVTGRARELQISLFDVSDLSNPTLAARYNFDVPGWAWSEALSDHHAVGYYPEQGVLAIPVSNEGWVGIDRNGDGVADIQTYRPRTDLWVFQIHVPGDEGQDARIEHLGTIEHDSDVRRSVRIADFLYSISTNAVTAHEILDPSNEIGRVHIGQETVGVPVFRADENDVIVNFAVQSPDMAPPQVINVAVDSTRWSGDFRSQLDTRMTGGLAIDPQDVLPYEGIDRIKVTFSEDVFVGSSDMRLRGVNASEYFVREFTYDTDTKTAVWTLNQALEADTLTVTLQHVIDTTGNRLDGDANGRAGGGFSRRFSVLPGDVDKDGRVDGADLARARVQPSVRIGQEGYQLLGDIDGNGAINDADLSTIASRAGTSLPGISPRVMGDASGDGRFDQFDLVQILQSNKYLTHEPASWAEGDFNRDGVFDQLDIIAALQAGTYRQDPVMAVDVVFEGR